ncbi:hypothetical protein HK099_006156 [Clydaea vesicula]|uniref:Uncharacterized protein n=1 Tax=Clydaea vesicula TaxID=447962 RepID=A0AAD5XZ92_9FUNG|nr:hypothetical protein HK099_006156 [Clydaea vesicula]
MTEKQERQQWPSRAAFLMASIGSAIGLGNLLRYPSVAWANYGVQWFIPYILALFLVGIPLLLLEIAMGQTYRSSNIVALDIVATYYNTIIAWCLIYLGNSFQEPLPWKGLPGQGADAAKAFFSDVVVRNVSASQGQVIWLTFAMCVIMWIFVYLSIFKGVDLLGKVVYFTMGVPTVMLVVIVIRGVTLENAWRGMQFYIGTARFETLGQTDIWQGAIGQIFFSIGAGFGVFTAYASYNPLMSHAVSDSLIVGISNSIYEIVAGFAAFGVAGFLNLDPAKDKLGTFTLGFFTYPAALANLPGAQVWSVIFFFTLFLLGIDSAFSLVEGLVTLLEDSRLSKKLSRPVITGLVCGAGVIISLMYSSDVGLEFLDQVDRYTNEFALPMVAFIECVAIGFVYRWKDAVGQVGATAFLINFVGYNAALLFGCIVAYVSNFGFGILIGFAIFFVTIAISVFSAKNPTVSQHSSPVLNKLYWLNLYNGDQLRKDLNAVVATHGRWEIPLTWVIIMKFLTGPICFIMTTLPFKGVAEAKFIANPIAVFGFFVGMLTLIFSLIGLVFPQAYGFMLPEDSSLLWKEQNEAGPGITIKPTILNETLEVEKK